MEIKGREKSKSAEQVLYLLCGASTYKLCASNCFPVRMFQQFPPVRLPEFVKLICRFDYPSPRSFEELHPHRVAVATQRLAVSHSSLRTKFSGARRQLQGRAFLPAPPADYAGAFHADVFRKRCFRAGQMPMSVEHDGNLHRDAIFAARKGMFGAGRHLHHPQRHAAMRVMEFKVVPRCFMRYRARSAAPRSFSGGIAVFGIGRDACANRKTRFLIFKSQTLADTAGDARRDFLGRFGKHQRKFVSAITRRGINRARVMLQEFFPGEPANGCRPDDRNGR